MSATAPFPYRQILNVAWGWVLVFATVAVTVPWRIGQLQFSAGDSLRIDLSGLIVMDHLFVNGGKFGTEIIFPYGPFLFLMFPIYWPGVYWYIICGRLLIAVALALGVWHLLRSLNLWNSLSALLSLVGLGCLYFIGPGFIYLTGIDSLLTLIAPLLLYCYAFDNRKRPGVATLLLAVAAALISLTRVSSFVLMGFIVALTVVADIAIRRRPPIVMGVFLGSFLALWAIAGQSVETIPAWISTSLEMGEKFTSSMGIGYLEPKRLDEVVVFLGSGGVLVVAHFLALRSKLWSFWENVLFSTGLILCIYVSYKHGIVRHDAHARTAAAEFVEYAALLLILVLGAQIGAWRRTAAVVALGLVIAINTQVVVSYGYATWNEIATDVQSNVAAMLRPAEVEAELRAKHDSDLRNFSQTALLPALAGTVDQWPDNGGVVVLAGYDYKPRPSFMSFSVYSKAVGQQNAAFFSGPEAPDHVLFQVVSIDGRLPTIDDPLSWTSLLSNYDISQASPGNLLVLDRRSSPRAVSSSPFLDTLIEWGQTLPLNAEPGRLVRMQLDLELTWMGQLLSLAYKPPEVWLEVEYRNGSRDRFRLVPENAKLGFILSPSVVDMHGMLELFGLVDVSSWREVVSVKIEQVPGLSFAYDKQTRVTLSYLDRDRAQEHVPEGPAIQRIVSLGQLRLGANSVVPPGIREIPGSVLPVLYAPAPNSLAVDIDQTAESVSLGFGIIPSDKKGLTGDGVLFQVLGRRGSNGGDEVLFERHLDPANNSEDLGTQTKTVAFKRGLYQELILQTNPGLNASPDDDQSFWSDVTVR